MANASQIEKLGKKKKFKQLYKIIRKGATYDTIEAVFEQLGTIKHKENFSNLCEMYRFNDPIVHLAVVKALCECAEVKNIEIIRHYQNSERDPECVELLKARVLLLKNERDRVQSEKDKYNVDI